MPGHDTLVAEAGALLDVVAARLQKSVERQVAASAPSATDATPEPPAGGDQSTPSDPAEVDGEPAAQGASHDRERCTGCPVCAALTYLDNHRDLAGQVAQGALIIVAALREYLDGRDDKAATAPEPVQRIDIR